MQAEGPIVDPELVRRALALLCPGSASLEDCGAWSEPVWDEFLRAARRQSLLPLLGASLSTAWPAPPPPEIEQILRRAYLESVVFNLAMEGEIARIDEALAEEPLPVMVLRGVPFARRAFGNPGARKIGDLDLLIRDHHTAAAERLLIRCGFRPYRSLADLEVIYQREIPVGTGTRTLLLDLHTGLVPSAWGYRTDLPKLIQRGIQLTPGSALLAPSPEDELLELILHSLRHGFGLRYLLDLAAALATERHSWEALVRRILRWRIQAPTHLALATARNLLGAPVPSEVLTELAPSRLRRLCLRWLGLPDLLSPPNRGLILRTVRELALQPSWQTGLFMAGRRLSDRALRTTPESSSPPELAAQFIHYSGDSMHPTFRDPEYLRLAPPGSRGPRVGDVIAYRTAPQELAVVHRVVATSPGGWITQGDNNPRRDAREVRPEEILGMVVGALRDGQQRRCLGGWPGRLQRSRVRIRRALLSHQGLRRSLERIHRTELRRIPWPKSLRPRPILFRSHRGQPQLRLFLGRRKVGYYDRERGIWMIRLPYRFLADPRQLERARQGLEEPAPGEEQANE